MNTLIVDCETNSTATDGNLTNLWMIGIFNPDEDTFLCYTEKEFSDPFFAEWLEETLNNNTIIFHNAMFDVWVLEQWFGIRINKWHDTMIMSYNYNPMGTHSLSSWGEFLGDPKLEFSDYDGGYSKEMEFYCQQDCRLTYKVFLYLVEEVPDIYKLDVSFTRLLIDMQARGITLNMEEFDKIIGTVKAELMVAEQSIHRICPVAPGKSTKTKNMRESFKPIDTVTKENYGELKVDDYLYYGKADGQHYWRKVEVYNPASTDQTAWLLKLIYGWEPKQTSAKTGKPTVDSDVLGELDYELAHLLVSYSEMNKLATTYGDNLKELTFEDRLYPSYNPCVTLTGRLSSSKPNIQNIPSKGEKGSQLRRLFVPRKGHTFIDVDIDAFQMRILAWYMHYYFDSESAEVMYDNFNFSDEADPHATTARLIFGDGFTPEQRKIAKAVNFGIIFGLGLARLSKTLGLTIPRTKKLMAMVEEAMPELFALKAVVVEECRANKGYVYTAYGRKGYYPKILSEDKGESSRAERQAFNFTIQGTEADIIKTLGLLIKEGLYAAELTGYILLQVHDEYLLEVPDYEVDDTVKVVNTIINNTRWLPEPHIKITGSAKAGKSWGECH